MIVNDETIHYTGGDIQRAVYSLSCEICRSIRLDNPLYLCIMNGGIYFFADITKLLPPGYCEFVKIQSYSDNVQGKLTFVSPIEFPKGFKQIIIFDDICDTGNTLSALVDILKQECKADIYTAVAIYRDRQDSTFKPDFAAITINNDVFFAGYGLDDKGYDRNLPYIYDVNGGE